ncbi:MAG: membrane protein insertase YidC [Parcubacteria group bacterium]|nr:membrane protein insertase YidC [Parcubacteria group bacterium]
MNIFYEPLQTLLEWLYKTIPGNDLGVAIILITILVKLVLLPFSLRALKAQKNLAQLQPKIEELKEKYKNEKEQLMKATMRLYKENKVNPFSSCLPLIIQIPVLFALYKVFTVGIKGEIMNHIAFGFLDLAKPLPLLALLTGGLQYLQMKMLPQPTIPKKIEGKPGTKDESMMSMMNKQMKIMMPLMTVFIGVTLPSGLILYWLVNLALTIGEQKLIQKIR